MISAREAHDEALSYRVEQSNKLYLKVENLILEEVSRGKLEALYFFKPEEYLIKDDVINCLRSLGYFVEYRESTQMDPAELHISWKEAKQQ